MELGDNLSNKDFLNYLRGATEDELLSQLQQIRYPYKLVTVYYAGNAHVAWVVPTMPLKKVSKPTEGAE